MVTRGDGRFSIGSATPHPRGVFSASPKIFGTPTYPARYDTATEFCMMIKLDGREIFTGSTLPRALAEKFYDANADARSVCSS